MIKKIATWIHQTFLKKVQPKEFNKRIVCLVGESGSGKTTLADAMERLGYKSIASYTTRPRRFPNEKHHRFVSVEEFQKMRPTLATYTRFDKYEYGVTVDQIEEGHVFVVDPDGVKYLAEHWGREHLLVILLYVSPLERMRRMEAERGKEAAAERLEHDVWKFSGFYDYDLLMPNETTDQFRQNLNSLEILISGWCNG